MSNNYNLYKEDIPEPSEFLIANLHLLRPGKALDVAMGNGRNAIYLAKNGFIVEGVDINQNLIEKVNKLAVEKRLSLYAEVADLEKDYKIKSNYYDLVICFYYLQRSLMEQIKQGIKYSGYVMYETYIIDELTFGKLKNPNHLLGYNELLQIFRDFRCHIYREGVINGIHGPRAIASILAQKV